MFAYCNYKGLGILGFSPLMDGHLARPLGTKTERSSLFDGTIYDKPRRECDKEIIRRVEELAKKKGVSMAQISLAWCMEKTTAPIIGTTSLSNLEDILGRWYLLRSIEVLLAHYILGQVLWM